MKHELTRNKSGCSAVNSQSARKSFLFDNSVDGILLLLSRQFYIARNGGQTFGCYALLKGRVNCH